MGFRGRPVALRRAALAAIVGAAFVVLSGPLLLLPALALVALTYWGHHVLWSLAGSEDVPHADLALVIVANSAIVLAVQVLLFAVTFVEG
ncbi:MAG TPA: hypothetical protein VFQ40_02030 [Actinomycetota bacterium]|nr:hypothetical protein [Actinomycetota bacterium]